MDLVRWILFLPAGFIASIVAGWLGNVVTEAVFNRPWLAWMMSGGASAFAFLIVGFRVAPRRTRILKWLLVSIILLLGVLSILGILLAGRKLERAMAGAAMVLASIIFARRSLDELSDLAASEDRPNK